MRDWKGRGLSVYLRSEFYAQEMAISLVGAKNSNWTKKLVKNANAIVYESE